MEPRISIITLGASDMTRAIRFYRDGLGFDTIAKDDADWAIFKLSGTRLSLYPKDLLAEDIAENYPKEGSGFSGVTLAHNVRQKEEVQQVLDLAAAAGGTLLKPAQDAFWGGFSGYFADPDGYAWEVAWAEDWEFDANGTLWGGSLGKPS